MLLTHADEPTFEIGINATVGLLLDFVSDPVDYVIPANDDASKSIDKIMSLVTAAVIDGLQNRNADAIVEDAETEDTAEVAEVAAPVAEAPAVEEVAAEVAEAPEANEEAKSEE